MRVCSLSHSRNESEMKQETEERKRWRQREHSKCANCNSKSILFILLLNCTAFGIWCHYYTLHRTWYCYLVSRLVFCQVVWCLCFYYNSEIMLSNVKCGAYETFTQLSMNAFMFSHIWTKWRHMIRATAFSIRWTFSKVFGHSILLAYLSKTFCIPDSL